MCIYMNTHIYKIIIIYKRSLKMWVYRREEYL